jgi:hypothetical protein
MTRLMIAALVLLCLRASAADACSCATKAPPCETMFLGTVFAGKVVGTTQRQDTATTTFEVDETLYSQVPIGTRVDVQHDQSTSCAMSFADGATYVVYAFGAPGALETALCTRTHRVDGPIDSDEDVRFARAGAKRTTAVVDGKVIVREQLGQDLPRAGVVLRVAGTRQTATTRTDGSFHVEVPPGSYTLEVVTPGLKPWWSSGPVHLDVPHPAACAHPEIDLFWDGRIAGRVTDAAGKPIAGVPVAAESTATHRNHGQIASTDADGRYALDLVPPGRYRVGVSITSLGGPSAQSPYPATYSRELVLGEATSLSKIDLSLPALLAERTLQVVVTDARRKPVNGGRVAVRRVDGTLTSFGTDKRGIVVLKEYETTQLELRACVRPPDSQSLCDERIHTVTGDATIELHIPAKPRRPR